MSAFAAMLSLGLPWRDWSLALASVAVSVQVWHLWPDAVSAPAPPTSERSMNEPHTKIQTHNPHIHTSWREHSHKYRSGQIQVPSLNYNETIYLLPCSFLSKFRRMNALHKGELIVRTVSFNSLFKTHTIMATAVCFCLSISALYFIRKFFNFF